MLTCIDSIPTCLSVDARRPVCTLSIMCSVVFSMLLVDNKNMFWFVKIIINLTRINNIFLVPSDCFGEWRRLINPVELFGLP